MLKYHQNFYLWIRNGRRWGGPREWDAWIVSAVLSLKRWCWSYKYTLVTLKDVQLFRQPDSLLEWTYKVSLTCNIHENSIKLLEQGANKKFIPHAILSCFPNIKSQILYLPNGSTKINTYIIISKTLRHNTYSLINSPQKWNWKKMQQKSVTQTQHRIYLVRAGWTWTGTQVRGRTRSWPDLHHFIFQLWGVSWQMGIVSWWGAQFILQNIQKADINHQKMMIFSNYIQTHNT